MAGYLFYYTFIVFSIILRRAIETKTFTRGYLKQSEFEFLCLYTHHVVIVEITSLK